MKKFLALLFLCAAGVALAQTVVTANQGQPGKQGPWPVTLQGTIFVDGGGLPTYPATCTSTTQGVTATIDGGAWKCPLTQLTGRKSLTLCNSAENSGTVQVKIRLDGTAPAAGLTTRGDVLAVGDCWTYAVPDTVSPICIDTSSGSASTAQQAVTSFECAY